MHPQGESIWGNINTCIEIALNVYQIYAEYGEGIMVPKNEKSALSENALKMGQEDGDYICFDENTKDIPIYEILQKRMALCKKIEATTLEMLNEIERDGKIIFSDYFGECSPPTNGKDKIHNGIYMTKDSHGEKFAVHEAIADNYMTPYAMEFGERQGDYFYYDLTTAAIPLFELGQVFHDVEALIMSKESLCATLNTKFPLYVRMYNSLVPEEAQISNEEAPNNLYFESQLREERKQMDSLPMADENEDEYGEEVEDFGFES